MSHKDHTANDIKSPEAKIQKCGLRTRGLNDQSAFKIARSKEEATVGSVDKCGGASEIKEENSFPVLSFGSFAERAG
jgi:hypothetical protein